MMDTYGYVIYCHEIDETGSSRLRLPGCSNHPGRPRFGGRAWQESHDGGACLMNSLLDFHVTPRPP